MHCRRSPTQLEQRQKLARSLLVGGSEGSDDGQILSSQTARIVNNEVRNLFACGSLVRGGEAVDAVPVKRSNRG